MWARAFTEGRRELSFAPRAVVFLHSAPSVPAREEVPLHAAPDERPSTELARNAQLSPRVAFHFPPRRKWAAVTRAGVSIWRRDLFAGMLHSDVRVEVVGANKVLRSVRRRAKGTQYMQAFWGDLTCVGLTLVAIGGWYIAQRR